MAVLNLTKSTTVAQLKKQVKKHIQLTSLVPKKKPMQNWQQLRLPTTKFRQRSMPIFTNTIL